MGSTADASDDWRSRKSATAASAPKNAQHRTKKTAWYHPAALNTCGAGNVRSRVVTVAVRLPLDLGGKKRGPPSAAPAIRSRPVGWAGREDATWCPWPWHYLQEDRLSECADWDPGPHLQVVSQSFENQIRFIARKPKQNTENAARNAVRRRARLSKWLPIQDGHPRSWREPQTPKLKFSRKRDPLPHGSEPSSPRPRAPVPRRPACANIAPTVCHATKTVGKRVACRCCGLTRMYPCRHRLARTAISHCGCSAASPS